MENNSQITEELIKPDEKKVKFIEKEEIIINKEMTEENIEKKEKNNCCNYCYCDCFHFCLMLSFI